MWTVLAIVCVLLGVAALAWRLVVIPRRAPDENDRSRQHEAPGAHRPPPPGAAGSPRTTSEPPPG